MANAKTVTLFHPDASLGEIERSLEIVLQDIQLRMGTSGSRESQELEKEAQNSAHPTVITRPKPKEAPPEDMLEIEYSDIIEPGKMISVPVAGNPVRTFLRKYTRLYNQVKKKHPNHRITQVDTTIVRMEGHDYYQPSRILLQRMRGKVVPPAAGQ